MSSGIKRLLISLFIDVTKDVVEYEIACWLLCKDEGLYEFLELRRFVGGLADNLDDNIFERGLRIDVGYTYFTILEVEFSDALLDGLRLLT